MKIQSMYNTLMSYMKKDSPNRREQKSKFIESRIKHLQSQAPRLTADELSSQLQNYLNYSTHGVVASLFHQKNLDSELKNKVLEELSFVTPVDSRLPFGSQGISAQTFTDGFPNFAVIYNENDGIGKAKVTTYSDAIELEQILKTTALAESTDLFIAGKISSDELITNFNELSSNQSEFVNNVFQYMKHDISDVAESLKSTINFEVELDKRLRQSFSDQKIESAIINYMIQDGSINEYTKSRISAERSPLSDEVQRKLIILVEKQYAERKTIPQQKIESQTSVKTEQNQELINNEITSASQVNQEQDSQSIENLSSEPEQLAAPENSTNEITSSDKAFTPKIGELSKTHETLFRKIQVGNQHYFESTDQSVKIHPEKVAVTKVSRDSVNLALDAAINSYGNNLSIRGTPEFKDIALSILSREQYKEIQLNNPELQERLNQMRGITPIENIIAPVGEKIDQEHVESKNVALETPQDAQQVDIDKQKTLLDTEQLPNVEPILTSEPLQITQLNDTQQENSENITAISQDEVMQEKPQEIKIETQKHEIDLFAAIDYRETTPQSINDFAKLVNECNNLEQVNEEGQTPLIYATSIGMTEEVKALLDAGANVNSLDATQSSALFYAVGAIQYNALDITHSLLKAGADTQLKNEYDGTVLLYAASNNNIDEKDRLSICSSLIQAGAKIDDRTSSKGYSALTYAVKDCDLNLVKLLLDSGADTTLRDNQQQGILHHVIESGPSLKITELLMQHGADPKALDENQREAPILNVVRIAEHFQEHNENNNSQSQSRSR